MQDTAQSRDPLPKVWEPESRMGDMLRGKRGLVVGIANENSIAFGCAAKVRAFGAELAVTYANEKSERYVRPLAEKIQADLIGPVKAALEATVRYLSVELGDKSIQSTRFPRVP